MAFKLTKSQLTERADAIAKIQAARTPLLDAITEFNELLGVKREAFEGLVSKYNQALTEAREFAERIATDAQEAIDAKSERWQESGKGQAASAFQEEWSNLDLADVELGFPDDLDELDEDPAETLEEAPEAAE